MFFRHKINRKYLGLGALTILLIFFHFSGLFAMPERLARLAFIPVAKTMRGWRVALANKYDGYKNRQKYESDYNNCQQELKKTNVYTAKIKELTDENQELKTIVKFQKDKNYQLVGASVIGRVADNMQKTIVIDAGAAQGVKVDLPVIAGAGVLVGKIVSAEKDIAQVRLVNDNQSKIAALILNKDKSMGAVEGGYGLSVRMNFIPRNETVMVGDKVITAGLDDNIPRGLLIGEIAVAENEAYQPYQQAVLATALDLDKLTIVAVLVSSSSSAK